MHTMPKLSILDEISDADSQLEQGQQLGQRAARVGFDWPDARQALEKVHEEVGELEELLDADDVDRARLSAELGDILFAVINVARKLNLSAEDALAQTNQKFRRRFAFIERELDRQGRQLEEVGLDEMEALWQQAKQP